MRRFALLPFLMACSPEPELGEVIAWVDGIDVVIELQDDAVAPSEVRIANHGQRLCDGELIQFSTPIWNAYDLGPDDWPLELGVVDPPAVEDEPMTPLREGRLYSFHVTTPGGQHQRGYWVTGRSTRSTPDAAVACRLGGWL